MENNNSPIKWGVVVFGLIGLLVMGFQIFAANYFNQLGSGFCMLTALMGAFVSGELIIIGLGKGK